MFCDQMFKRMSEDFYSEREIGVSRLGLSFRRPPKEVQERLHLSQKLVESEDPDIAQTASKKFEALCGSLVRWRPAGDDDAVDGIRLRTEELPLGFLEERKASLELETLIQYLNDRASQLGRNGRDAFAVFPQ